MKSSPMRLRSTVFTIFIAEKHLSTDAVATGSTNTNLRSRYTNGKARRLFVLTISLAGLEILFSPKCFLCPNIINEKRKLMSKVFQLDGMKIIWIRPSKIHHMLCLNFENIKGIIMSECNYASKQI